MKDKFTKFLAVITIFSTMFLMAGCGETVIEPKGENDIQATIQKLDDAEVIKANKSVLSFGDHWEILADNEKVGEVHGKFLYIIGDTYSFTTNNGYFVGAEQENFAVIQRNAGIYNENEEKIGEIKQEIFTWLIKFTLYKNDEINATTEQNFSLNLSADIKDSDGIVNWHVNRKLISWGSKLEITKETTDPDVEALDALWMSLILNEVYEASNSNNGSS